MEKEAIRKSGNHGSLVANLEHIPFETDLGIGKRANLGLLVLRTDQTIEDEFRFVLSAINEVAVYEARLYNEVEITPENLMKMEREIPRTAGLLPDVKFDAIGFACTSGALVIGEERVADRIRDVHPHVHVTDPITAVRASFRALGAQRIALLTPYVSGINHSLRSALQTRGLEIQVMGSFNEVDDNVVARITSNSLERAIMQIGASDACDAIFVACTSLRVARIVERVESQLGKPVTSSNHALAWHMLRLSGLKDEWVGMGKLYRSALAC